MQGYCVVAFLLTVSFNQGFAIRCYKCTTSLDSTEKEACDDSFTGERDTSVLWAECEFGCEKRVLYRAKDLPRPGEWFEEDVYMITRDCATSKHTVGCTETKKEFYQNVYTWTERCFCTGWEGCNSATLRVPNRLMALLMSLSLILVKFVL